MEALALHWGGEVKLEKYVLAMDVVGDVIAEGDENTRLWALRVMALVVARFPDGSLQDRAEDILSSFLAEAKLSEDDLASVREVRCTGSLLAIC